MKLVVYEAACRAVAQAKTIDEVKEITNRAEAARAYARQSKNRQLEIDAMEIRVRAERRLGEIIVDMKSNHLLGKQGQFHGKAAADARKSLLTLKDIGIDSDDSGIAQRLAKLPEPRFEQEISSWRSKAETALRFEAPLQNYRRPSIRADRQRAAVKLGRPRIDDSDPLDRFRAPDGRRVADWRAGELDRLEATFVRAVEIARRLRSDMPVANPDPLATVEMIYRVEPLRLLLEEMFSQPIPSSDAGLSGQTIRASRVARTRTCEHCSKTFVMDSRMNSAGRFCSRQCAVDYRRAKTRRN